MRVGILLWSIVVDSSIARLVDRSELPDFRVAVRVAGLATVRFLLTVQRSGVSGWLALSSSAFLVGEVGKAGVTRRGLLILARKLG